MKFVPNSFPHALTGYWVDNNWIIVLMNVDPLFSPILLIVYLLRVRAEEYVITCDCCGHVISMCGPLIIVPDMSAGHFGFYLAFLNYRMQLNI